jgi:hypothetical protein
MRTMWLVSASLAVLLSGAMLACTGGVTGASFDPGGDDTPGGDGDDDEFNQPDAAVCDQTVPITVTQTQKTPDMLLVVDKSGSMDEELTGTGQSKMDVLKTAMSQVLPGQNNNIRFGLALYPTSGDCGVSQPVSGVAAGNAVSVIGQLSPIEPGGATPTHLALDAARSYFANIPVNPDGRYVLLATDGLPNCDNGDSQEPSNDATQLAAQRLAQDNIRVFVIGFGDIAVADPTFLTSLAIAGGTGDFFAANSPGQLQAALAQISGTVVEASCDFALASVPEDPAKLGVTLDGTPVPRDPSHQTGWDYDANSNSVIFYGDTCQQIQSGVNANVGVDYGCGSVVIG